MTGLWIALGVVAGFAAGVMWREAYELLTRRDDPVALWRRLRGARLPILTIALILSMTFTGVVGIMVALANNDRSNLIGCITDYNTEVGDARAAREVVARDLTEAEIAYVEAELTYQRGLVESLQEEEPTVRLQEVIAERIAATDDYQVALVNLNEVRDDKPYPAPDLCQGGR